MIRSILLAALAATGAFAQPAKPVDLHGVAEQHIMLPMRDGVRLSTYIYTPPGQGPWPVLYEQRHANVEVKGTQQHAAKLAAHGYVVVEQNFRGARLSEGVFESYRSLGWLEHKDGYDTVEWLAKQPWSTGKVGTFGGSQSGFAQSFIAVAAPPHLACQFIYDTGLSSFHHGFRFGGTTRARRYEKTHMLSARDPEDARRALAIQFQHPDYDDYWRQEDCTLHFGEVNVPAVALSSWFDFMSTGGIETFIGRQHQGGPNARGRQKLIIGAWQHGGTKMVTKVGDLEFPDNARFDMDGEMIRWFDYHLKGKPTGIENDPAVRYYVTGASGEPGAPGNVWREAADWPVKARDAAYYLGVGGKLSANAGAAKATTEFIADPEHPVPLSGRAFVWGISNKTLEQHADARSFSTEPLAEPVEWTGKVRAELFVSSSARDADFLVTVSDVYPDGRSILFISGIRRARYRESYAKPSLLTPGKTYKIAFDVGWLSHVFNRGHRIRVTVAGAGSDFTDANPNTGDASTIGPPPRTVIAKNTIYHGGAHASRVSVTGR